MRQAAVRLPSPFVLELPRLALSSCRTLLVAKAHCAPTSPTCHDSPCRAPSCAHSQVFTPDPCTRLQVSLIGTSCAPMPPPSPASTFLCARQGDNMAVLLLGGSGRVWREEADKCASFGKGRPNQISHGRYLTSGSIRMSKLCSISR